MGIQDLQAGVGVGRGAVHRGEVGEQLAPGLEGHRGRQGLDPLPGLAGAKLQLGRRGGSLDRQGEGDLRGQRGPCGGSCCGKSLPEPSPRVVIEAEGVFEL